MFSSYRIDTYLKIKNSILKSSYSYLTLDINRFHRIVVHFDSNFREYKLKKLEKLETPIHH